MKRRPGFEHRVALRTAAALLAVSLPVALLLAAGPTGTPPALADSPAPAPLAERPTPSEPPPPTDSPMPSESSTPSAPPTPVPSETPTPTPSPTDPDRDGDGVPDASDRCPDDPGPADNDGCPPDTYVALGDSYSAGEGADAYLPGTDVPGDRCHRSANAYPELVQATEGYAGFAFHACSGARTSDFTADNHRYGPAEPAQVSWLGPDTRVVTFSVGGNDIGFTPVLRYCVERLPGSPTCQQAKGARVDAEIAGLRVSLPPLLDAVKRAAPNATVVVLGYPRFFPTDPPRRCLAAFRILRSDMLWINGEVRALDDVVGAAATAAGVTYVDNYDAFDGTEVCGSGTPASVFGVRPKELHGSFHPTPAGQAILARRLEPFLPGR